MDSKNSQQSSRRHQTFRHESWEKRFEKEDAILDAKSGIWGEMAYLRLSRMATNIKILFRYLQLTYERIIT